MLSRFFWLFLFLAVNSYAAFKESDAGTSSGQFLKLGAGARNSAMGDTGAAISEGPGGIYWNAAGVAYSERPQITAMHAVWFGGIGYSWLGYTQPVKGGAVGFDLQYLNYGSIQGTDDLTGASNGSFNPNDLAAAFVYSFKTGKDLSVGLGGKVIRSRIKETGQAFAGDAGLLYKPTGSRLSFGVAAQNLGGRIKYVDKSEKLPVTLRAGVGFKASKGLLLAVDAAAFNDSGVTLGAGGEYKCNMTDNVTIVGRAGYNTQTKAISGLTGLTLGAGLSYKAYELDYAYVPFGVLGDTNRVSLGIKF